ncbi:MAG: hypothetical protein IPJ74_24305 [Saprospiraceae bacterium]|nr:hypothetical protein [Saprospiraceae bacterium]
MTPFARWYIGDLLRSWNLRLWNRNWRHAIPISKLIKGSCQQSLGYRALFLLVAGFMLPFSRLKATFILDPLLRNQTQYCQAYYTRGAIQDDDANQPSGVTDGA